MQKDFQAAMKQAIPMYALSFTGIAILSGPAVAAAFLGEAYLAITLASMSVMWGIWSLIGSVSAEALLLLLQKPVCHRRIARYVAPFAALAALLPLLTAKAQPAALAIESQRAITGSSVDLTLWMMAAGFVGVLLFMGRRFAKARPQE